MSDKKKTFLGLLLLFTPTMLVVVGKLVTGSEGAKIAPSDLGHGVGEGLMRAAGRDFDDDWEVRLQRGRLSYLAPERETRRQAARAKAQLALDELRAEAVKAQADAEEIRRGFAEIERFIAVAGEIGGFGDRVSGQGSVCPTCGHPLRSVESGPTATAPAERVPSSSTSRPR